MVAILEKSTYNYLYGFLTKDKLGLDIIKEQLQNVDMPMSQQMYVHMDLTAVLYKPMFIKFKHQIQLSEDKNVTQIYLKPHKKQDLANATSLFR